MDIDHDNHDLAHVSNREKFTKLLTKYVTYAAPRVFALCQEPWGEDTKGWIFSWGAAFEDNAVLFSSDGKLAGICTSADSALDLFSRTQDLRLVWVDPTIYDQPDTITT
jgi:hypothetical protein